MWDPDVRPRLDKKKKKKKKGGVGFPHPPVLH